jgi:hypothetical protein
MAVWATAISSLASAPNAVKRAVLDDRDAAAEPPHGLDEFQADVAAAEDDE